jgi:hypothetical protein
LGPPMTLANMRANGVRAVIATCEACGHKADVNVDALPENVTVPAAGGRLRCGRCEGKRINTRPASHMASNRHGVPRLSTQIIVYCRQSNNSNKKTIMITDTTKISIALTHGLRNLVDEVETNNLDRRGNDLFWPFDVSQVAGLHLHRTGIGTGFGSA